MEVGREFSSWDSFQNALDQYSQENKVVYIVGTCKPVETANKNELLHSKFPSRFKYCFVRMVCKHFGNYSSRSAGQRPNQRTCKTGCTSSILLSVNKKRTSLVIKEANLQHSHAVSESIFSSYSQTRRLQGDERRMASVLLRAGVPLLRVQEFISHASRKDPTIKDLQNLRSSALKGQGVGLGDGVKAEEFAFLSDVDKLMAEDSGSIVEIINFDLVPGAIYIQTSSMIEATKILNSGQVQVITHRINEGKVSVVSIVGVDANQDTHVLALCVIMIISDTALRCFFEAFVRNNPVFSDSVNGIVLDCSKENAEFFQQLVPQAHIAWSRSYVMGTFLEEAKAVSNDVEKYLQLCKSLMEAENSEVYEQNLKCLMASINSSYYKEFLQTWNSSKELWVQYEIASFSSLQHQKASKEVYYLSLLKIFMKASMTSSEIIKALLKFVRNEEPEESETQRSTPFELDPSCKLYSQICFPAAYHATECQISLALGSVYEVKQHTDMIFVKKKDSEEEYVLDVSGKTCTCPYFQNEELPCQHIFAWLKFSGKSLFDESLIPAKWQVFGTAVTLDAIAESLAQGQVPSSLEHDERIKELQNLLKDILAFCCAHSFQQMARDLVFLRQVLLLMKTSSSFDAKVVLKKINNISRKFVPLDIEYESSENTGSSINSVKKPGRPPGKRGRGRPSNKERQLRLNQEQEEAKKSVEHGYSSDQSPVKAKPMYLSASTGILPARHNLRRNIKHKFVTREASDRVVGAITVGADAEDGEGGVVLPGTSLSVVQVEEDADKVITSVLSEDRTEIYRAVRPKPVLLVENSLSCDAGSQIDNNVINTNVHPNTNESEAIATGINQTVLPEYKNGQGRSLIAEKKYYVAGDKRPRQDSEDDNKDDGSDSSSEDDSDEGEHETVEERTERRREELSAFISEFSNASLNDMLQAVSVMSSVEEGEQKDSTRDSTSQHPPDVLVNSCEDYVEVDYISTYISNICPGLSHHTYQVASALFCRAHQLDVQVTSLLQTLSLWPSHLPDFPESRPFESETTLSPGQTLTVCGHKLSQEDMDSLRPGKEISSVTVHAYLEILAQRHSGKMFVLPFTVVHVWRNGTYTDMLFKKVHFKTFEYLVLPIHCGGEFSAVERETGDLMQPCWMVLVANVKERTVSVLNPRTDDRYIIAANGYMLQWRRYMQIRSVHTKEMLSAWTTRHIECSKMDEEGLSAVMLLMNVETLVCGVHPAVMHPAAHASRFRHHVAASLRDTDWQTTVLCVGGPECQRKAARDADWLQCENCRAWWHRACAFSDGSSGDSRKSGVFYCTSCRQRIQALDNGERGGVNVVGLQNDVEEEGVEENVDGYGEEIGDDDEGEEMEYDGRDEERDDGEETMRIEEVGDGEDETEDTMKIEEIVEAEQCVGK